MKNNNTFLIDLRLRDKPTANDELSVKTAVDGDDVTGYISCQGRYQEGYSLGHFLGLTETTGRNGLLEGCLVQALNHIGLDKAGSKGIDGYVLLGHFLSQGLGGCND